MTSAHSTECKVSFLACGIYANMLAVSRRDGESLEDLGV